MTPDHIKADMQAGTPGPWLTRNLENFGHNVVWYRNEDKHDLVRVAKAGGEADARRIARVPDLEQAYLDHAAEIAALEAQIVRIEGRLTERRKMHRTDVLLARTADVRAQIAGVRPADAMAVSHLEEAYTDYVTRLDGATAQIATLTAERDAAYAEVDSIGAERERWKEKAEDLEANMTNRRAYQVGIAVGEARERDAARAVAFAEAAEIAADFCYKRSTEGGLKYPAVFTTHTHQFIREAILAALEKPE
jgi:hypothetical protein